MLPTGFADLLDLIVVRPDINPHQGRASSAGLGLAASDGRGDSNISVLQFGQTIVGSFIIKYLSHLQQRAAYKSRKSASGCV